MRLDAFDFHLPPEQIAQAPADRRDASRLLVLRRAGGGREHHPFVALPDLLREGDLLVLNDARVVPARLLGEKVASGGKAELLVVRPATPVGTAEALRTPAESLDWVCLGKAGKGLRPGTRLRFQAGLFAEIIEECGEGEFHVRFESEGQTPLALALERAGRLPLPPYIHRPVEAADEERYQTVYAQSPGSVAAPTAGLHFTPEVFARLTAAGVERTQLTLDVGPGTFLPVRGEEVEAHRMHPERFHLPQAAADAVNRARAEGRRVVAVGTTVVRTLEAATAPDGTVRAGPGETSLFIRPGYCFRQVDVLLTNFHLPRSTLLMLVSAFAGRESTLLAYAEAVAAGYRFFSYGDAMLVVD